MNPTRERHKLYFALVVALAPVSRNESPAGICHLAGEIADAAIKEHLFRERGTKQPQRVASRRLTEEEEIAERRLAMGLPAKRPTLNDD